MKREAGSEVKSSKETGYLWWQSAKTSNKKTSRSPFLKSNEENKP